MHKAHKNFNMEHCSKVGNPFYKRIAKGGETETRTSVVRQRWFLCGCRSYLDIARRGGGADLLNIEPTFAFIRFP